MGRVYVFGPNESENDYSTMGLVGALTPSEGLFKETANGDSLVTMTHPLDRYGRYQALQKGNILVVPVPVRTTPEIQNGSCVTTVWTYQVKPLAQLTSKAQRTLYKKKTGTGVMKIMKAGDVLTVVSQPEDADRWKVKSKYGTGWVDPDGITLITEHIIPDNSSAIEEIQSSWTITDQYFRIYRVVKNLNEIQIEARHIRYDLLYNKTRWYSNVAVTLQTAITGILDNCYNSHDFQGYTNVLNTAAGLFYKLKNPIEAFIDPEAGVCKRFNVGMVADNYELYFLNDPGVNRGVRIKYAKNMLGVEFDSSDEEIATRIIPIGETKDGEDFFLSNVVTEQYIDSPNIGLYPIIHTYELRCDNCKVGDADEGGGTITEAIARARMRQQAEDLLATECDIPEVSMSVEFLNLGDTEEYKQFRNLENVFLFDYVTIEHPDLGIDVTARISEIEWDFLIDRLNSVQIGKVGQNMANVGITTWQVPTGFSGSKIAGGTVGSGALRSDIISARHVQADSVNASAIQANSITAVKIAAAAIEAEKIKAGAVTADAIAAKAITAGKIDTDAIDADNIKAGVIDATRIKSKTLTAEEIKAGAITADNGIIISLNADVISAGTLSVHRLLLVGEGSVIHEINATSSGVTATELTQEEYQNHIDGSIIVAKSITAEEIDVTNLFANQATIDELKVMTVASLLNGSVLELNENTARFQTPEFIIQIPGAEPGEYVAHFDKFGGYSPNFESPTLATRRPGGIYRVYVGGDYDSLADVFEDLNGAVLEQDVVLKLGANDSGGVLRGVRGGYRVIITSGNILERYSSSANNATLAADGTYGYKVIASSTGTYRYVKILIGRVGDLGLAGKQMTMSVDSITSVGGTSTLVVLRVYDPTGATLLADITSVYEAGTTRTGVIPDDCWDDNLIMVVAYVSQATSCTSGAYVVYDRLRVEIGDSTYSWPTAKYNVSNLEVEGCDEVDLGIINLPTGARIRNSNAILSRSEIYNTLFVANSRLRMNNNKGTCTQAVKADTANVYVTGPAPGGTYDGSVIDTTTATISGSGSAPTTVVKALNAIRTGSYVSSGWIADQIIRQGYTTSRGRHYGTMWFDMTQIPAGATVTEMKLTVRRNSTFGVGGNVTIKAYGTADTSKSGSPAPLTGPYTLGTIGKPQTKTFVLPTALRDALAAGTAKGIVFYADDTTPISGESYSANFAGFEGTDATKPVLTVTYTV